MKYTDDYKITICEYEEPKPTIFLPYDFFIYNEGKKNVEFGITLKNINNIYYKCDHDKSVHLITLPLPADKLYYSKDINKETTNNWNEIPSIVDTMTASPYYFKKQIGGKESYYNYHHDWQYWFKILKPYIHGKISVTLDKGLNLSVNDEKFNAERNARIAEMSDLSLLKTWKEDTERKEEEERTRIENEKRAKEEKIKKYNEWYNSLSKDERLSILMGYGSGHYMGD